MTMPLRYLRLLPHAQLRRPRSRLSLNLRGERHVLRRNPTIDTCEPFSMRRLPCPHRPLHGRPSALIGELGRLNASSLRAGRTFRSRDVELKTGDILGTTCSPLLSVPLGALAIQDATIGNPVPQPATTTTDNTDSRDEPPADLLGRLEEGQLESFIRLWDTVPPHIRRIDFALDASG